MYSPKRYPPAGARDQRSLPCSCWDFPRIRGEKLAPGSRRPTYLGSPPHTRGKVFCLGAVPLDNGITPAYAGKSPSPLGTAAPGGDHPRIRGEKHQFPRQRKMPQGSPPHTRGKASLSNQRWPRFGITPAYAGKRPIREKRGRLHRDHPRIRGEKSMILASMRLVVGSPPHTRGKDFEVIEI